MAKEFGKCVYKLSQGSGGRSAAEHEHAEANKVSRGRCRKTVTDMSDLPSESPRASSDDLESVVVARSSWD